MKKVILFRHNHIRIPTIQNSEILFAECCWIGIQLIKKHGLANTLAAATNYIHTEFRDYYIMFLAFCLDAEQDISNSATWKIGSYADYEKVKIEVATRIREGNFTLRDTKEVIDRLTPTAAMHTEKNAKSIFFSKLSKVQ